MWWLLEAWSLLHLLGTTHELLGKGKPDNPEVNMNISEIITYWGYCNEEYEVVTEDGYILVLNRIPCGKNASRKGPQPVVYLQHGLLTSASNWISNLPNNSLAFMAADAGFDVWMGNSRGNTWSKKNVHFPPNSSEFWAFSFDEMAKYDLPATINFILETTGQEQLFYVGHSQGSTIGDQNGGYAGFGRIPVFVTCYPRHLGQPCQKVHSLALIAFSTNQALAKKIKVLFSLSPVSTMKYTKSPLRKLVLPEKIFKILLGDTVFYPNSFLGKLIATQICGRKILDQICLNALLITGGYNDNNLNMSRLDVYLSLNPSGTSIQNIVHWMQAMKTGQFQAYDWGSSVLNMMHFNQTTPPFYRAEDMKVPIAIWSGGNDWFASPKDVENLLHKLPNLIYHKKIPSYNHVDFLWGMDVPQQIYNELIQIMKQYV